MPHTPALVAGETKTERLTAAVTKTELAALAFVLKMHGDKYDGVSSVLRDYSLTAAVEFHHRAKQLASA